MEECLIPGEKFRANAIRVSRPGEVPIRWKCRGHRMEEATTVFLHPHAMRHCQCPPNFHQIGASPGREIRIALVQNFSHGIKHSYIGFRRLNLHFLQPVRPGCWTTLWSRRSPWCHRPSPSCSNVAGSAEETCESKSKYRHPASSAASALA